MTLVAMEKTIATTPKKIGMSSSFTAALYAERSDNSTIVVGIRAYRDLCGSSLINIVLELIPDEHSENGILRPSEGSMKGVGKASE